MKTRPAGPPDIDFLADVFLTSMREAITASRGYWDAGKENAQFRQQLDLSQTCVIQVDDVDVGYYMTRLLGGRAVELHTLCLMAHAQGNGVGGFVMRELMQAARSSESILELSVLKTNPRARNFYARLGFVEIGHSSHHIRMRWSPPG